MIRVSEYEHLTQDLKDLFVQVPLIKKKKPAWLVTCDDVDRLTFEKFIGTFTHDGYLTAMEPLPSIKGRWMACVFFR